MATVPRGWREHTPYDAIAVEAGWCSRSARIDAPRSWFGSRAVQKIITAARVSRTSAPFHLIGEEGWATAKQGEARALARRALRPVSLDEEMLVRNLADAAESFPSIEGLTCP
jgi:hypothetical protein